MKYILPIPLGILFLRQLDMLHVKLLFKSHVDYEQ